MSTNVNGIIYYKLDAEVNGYVGDITKNCGLRGEEIDHNFNFLRGSDIAEVFIDKDGVLNLKRYNGDILSTVKSDSVLYDFKYDSINGILTVKTPDGNEQVLEGFMTHTLVYHNNSMLGDGSIINPLKLSNISKTGQYLPAISFIDMTSLNNEGLPTENIRLNDRYVTKEKVSRFGKLYPINGVNKINERLSDVSSEWRVPTKEDWDELLNAIDCAKPEHSATTSNVFLGEFAGAALKGHDMWNSFNGKVLSDDKYNFSIYPVGYAGYRGKEYYGSFGLSSAFWTSTEEGGKNDMYVKLFDYNEERVGQNSWGGNNYLSLRLVKTFNGSNFNEVENIDGYTVECLQIPGTKNIWTKNNIGFSQTQYEPFTPNEWENYEEYDVRYYVNDWNGSGWDKHELGEGEEIVINNFKDGHMRELILSNGELIDISEVLKSAFQEELNKLDDKINQETNNRISADEKLQDDIVNEQTERIESHQNLLSQIIDEENKRISADEKLQNDIVVERNERLNSFEELKNSIDAEKESNLNAHINLQSKIDKNTADISNEITDRKNDFTKLGTDIKLSEQKVLSEVEKNTIEIEKLNESSTVEGSIKNVIYQSVIGGDIPSENVTGDEKSLLRKYVNDNGAPCIFASNDTEDMIHENEQLKQVINELLEKINILETKIDDLERNVVTNISGTDNEIDVKREGNSIIIGFASDARFVAG